MNTFTLGVDGALPGKLSFELQRPAGDPLRLERTTKLTVEQMRADPSRLDQLLPSGLTDELRQWDVGDSTQGLLAVVPANSVVDGIPWEYLPKLLELPTAFVVRRLAHEKPSVDGPVPGPTKLLAAGWLGKPIYNLPGIQAELAALSQLGTSGDVEVQVLIERGIEVVGKACSEFRPHILHLVPAGISNRNPVPEMVHSGDRSITLVPMDRFLDCLPGDLQPRLVAVNACRGGESGSGPSAIRMIAERLHTVAIGWLGTVEDQTAVQYARFLYARLLDGETLIDALRAYRALGAATKIFDQAARDVRPVSQGTYGAIPVVWTASISLLTVPLREGPQKEGAPAQERKEPAKGAPRGVPRAARAAAAPITVSEPSLPTLDVEFEPQKWLNPALLQNGRPAISKLVLTSDRAVRNIGVAVCCDTGAGISTFRQTLDLVKGSQPVLTINTWQFPVLYELIGAAVPRRQINFSVTCTLAGEVLYETTVASLWMGRTEWLDKPDTWRFIPAFVDPNADSVLDVIGKADDPLRKLADPKRCFNSYQSGEATHVSDQVKAVFNCLRDKPYELRYIAPPPILVYVPGEEFASGQRVRRLDEVVSRCRGTCHDLAVLFASCLEQIQIYPLIILITGHTLFGFWKDAQAHEEFWKKAGDDQLRRPSEQGTEWTITSTEEIQDLLNRNLISLVDAVRVTDRNATFEDAVAAGFDWFKETTNVLTALRFDVAVDIQQSRRYVQPL